RDYAYFAAIDDELDNGGREALLYHLLSFDLSSVNLREIPRTDALIEQKIQSLSPEMAWWLDILKNGRLPWGDLNDPVRCRGKALFQTYARHAQRTGAPHRKIETAIGIFPRDVVPKLKSNVEIYPYPDGMGGQGTDRGTVYTFPPLGVCRETFAEKLQQDF